MHIGVRDEAVTLRAVISTVFSTLEIEEVLAGIVDIATEATGSHACLIYLVDGDRLVLAAASPVHREFVGRIEMGFDEGLTGWAARHNRAALVRDGAMDDPRMRYFPELEEERWQSITAVPIPSRAGDVIGVIVLHAEAPREFTEDDVELLTHMATLVGGGIEDAQRFDEARSRVTALTELAEVSQRLAAATRHERLHEAATAGARSLLGAGLCQLFRLEAGGNELSLVASDPPGAPGPRPQGGALLLELLARGRHGGTARDLWPEHEGEALLTTPLIASDEQLGLLCVLRPRRFRPGDEELLRALADQTAMGLERADLIARLTARDRVKGLFDALEGDAGDGAVAAAAPAGCDLARPHVVLAGEGAADWEAVAGRLAARLRGRDQAGFFDAGRDALRAVVLMPDAAAAERVIAQCQAVGAAEGVAIGVSAPGPRRPRDAPGGARGGARRAARAHAAARRRRARLRRARRLQVPAPPARRRPAARPPLDRGRDVARVRRAAAHGAARHARGVPRPAALGRRDRPRAVHPPEHAAPAARADRAAHRAHARVRGPAGARARGEARQAGRRSASRRRLITSQIRSAT